PADRQLAEALKIKAALCVPLQRSGRILGVATGITTQGPRTFTSEEVELALGMAGAAALAVENAKLFEETRRLTVVEERQRLARELHDSVTQALYGVTLFAKAAASALAAGKGETAAGYLHKLRETAQEATADMRLLVFQLHPPVLEKEGLVAALQARLAAVEARAGLQTEFRVEGDERRLPVEVEEELYWIAQEALNNVLKHARASRASLCIEFKDETVSLDVCDNGVGFDGARARELGGVGLRSIAERAARVRGRWTLASQPGQGARLLIEVPATSVKV
ncbi:MAG TPA: GAF domain-containing sensor histidine kinase, partial [Anaerolineae bacterium]